jgi:glycosyltransferase involved in cell wall biosynthesis
MPSVLLISNGFQPDYEAGFANGLARNGVKVILVSSNRTLTEHLDPSVHSINLRGSQDQSRPAWQKLLNMIWYYIKLLILLARYPKMPVHMIGLFAISNPSIWKWECILYGLFGRRMVMTVHNVVPHDRDNNAIRLGLLSAYQLPDFLIVHTRGTADQLIKDFGVKAERIMLMEHGINQIPFIELNEVTKSRVKNGIAETERLVVFFGSVMPYKGVDILLDVAAVPFWDAKLLIAGRCADANYGSKLEEQISCHPNKDRIIWDNRYLSEEEVKTILLAADVVVLPYRSIDQSGVLFAALKYGLPVVAFNVGSLREYLIDGVGRIIAEGDISTFAKAVMEIEPASLVRSSIQKFAEQFLWHFTVRPILFIYED